MGARGQSGLKSKFFYLGALFCLNIGIVALMWRFRGSRWILALFSLAWVVLVTVFAWEIVTRAKLLDRMVQARTDALEASNRHLSGLLRQLRTFHRISYEMNQHLKLEQITGSFVRQLHRSLPQVQAVWLWLERALLQVDRDRLPKAGPLTRPLDLAARAGDDFGSPEELAPLRPGTPLLAECPESRGVTVVGDLPRQAEEWGWQWLADTPMECFAGFYLHIGDRLLGVLGVFSMVPLSGEFIRQLHLSVNQLTVALEKSRLLRQMQRRAAELAAVNQELRQLDAMKDWFVSSVSHELRTPLTNIRSYSEILENYADLDPEERREFAEIIREESERLSTMINNVLDLAKIASGEVRLQPHSVDLRALV
ncbi:MAG: histidine kinase dimerization/phospho-acceptor domain-containing protein, partial [Candidatus Brocadiia bacterium]